jgi:hypothetical protein
MRVKIRSEQKPVKELESEVKRLKVALAGAVLAKVHPDIEKSKTMGK